MKDEITQEDVQHRFRISHLTGSDIIRETDQFVHFKKMVLESEPMYPGIGRWMDEKVCPGLRSGERAAFVGYEGEVPVASAVMKKGERTKFCHLKLRADSQQKHLGELLFSFMVLAARGCAREIHFTLPESLWEEKRAFFQSFAFEAVAPTRIRYRLGEMELCCSASFSEVWRQVVRKIPKLGVLFLSRAPLDGGVLMSIRPPYVEKILSGRKTVEIRKRFSEKWAGRRLYLYASAPWKAIVGEATIAQVESAPPSIIWEKFQAGIGCRREQFEDYAGSLQTVTALALTAITRYNDAVPLRSIEEVIGFRLSPPQSFLLLNPESSWSGALSIAAFARGTQTLISRTERER